MTSNCRINFIISAFFSSCQVPAQEGERDALTEREQDRCHVFSEEKSNKTRRKSHGFELSRTVSCKPDSYRLMVTLSVPTLPLVSNVRNEIVCSPGPRLLKSTE